MYSYTVADLGFLKGGFWSLLGSAIWKINFYKSIPLPLWDVHGSIPLLDPPWNRRHDSCLHRNIDFRISRDAKFIFKISCSTQRTEWNLLLSQILSRVVAVQKYTQMIYWIFGTGLLSLKQQKNKNEFLNSSWPTSQDKKSQLFFTGLW